MTTRAGLVTLALLFLFPLEALSESLDYGSLLSNGQPVADGNRIIRPVEPPGPKPKVIEGKPAYFREVVKVTFTVPSGGTALCSGIAVASDRVLTAGHCGCADVESYRVTVNAERVGFGVDPPTVHALSKPPVLYRSYDCANAPVPQPGRVGAVVTAVKNRRL
jgi:Trypsin